MSENCLLTLLEWKKNAYIAQGLFYILETVNEGGAWVQPPFQTFSNGRQSTLTCWMDDAEMTMDITSYAWVQRDRRHGRPNYTLSFI